MADSTTNVEQVQVAQAQKEVTVNGLFDAVSQALFGGRHAEACSGLVWGYYGGRWAGSTVSNGTVTLAASTVNYIVSDRATGAILLDTNSPTHWSDTSTYARLYKVTTGAAAASSYEDHRAGPGGLYDGTAALALAAGVAAFLAGPSSANLATAVTDETGSGALVFATSPSLVTPALGVASATSVNKVAITAPASSATLTIANGKTLTSNASLTLAGTDGKTLSLSNSLTLAGTDSTTMTFPPASANVGYLGIPQNSKSADYTTVAADAGKHIYHPAADTTARTWTIDSNANVAYEIGTAITFDNDYGAGALTIAITSDTLVLVGSAGSTGSRTLASGGQATAIKVGTTRWRISGTGLS
jgi:hypothetical protein